MDLHAHEGSGYCSGLLSLPLFEGGREGGLCYLVSSAGRWFPIFSNRRTFVFSRILAKCNKINNTIWLSRSHYHLYNNNNNKKTLYRKGKTSIAFGKVELHGGQRGVDFNFSQCSPGLFRALILVIIAQVWREFLLFSSSQNHLCFRIFRATNSICFQIETRLVANVIPSFLGLGWKRESKIKGSSVYQKEYYPGS